LINLEWIQACVQTQSYRYSLHGERERVDDTLDFGEVEQALLSGRILEQYKNTGRGESCLVVGFTNSGKPIHIVCGRIKDEVVIITVYIPTLPKFLNPFEQA